MTVRELDQGAQRGSSLAVRSHIARCFAARSHVARRLAARSHIARRLAARSHIARCLAVSPHNQTADEAQRSSSLDALLVLVYRAVAILVPYLEELVKACGVLLECCSQICRHVQCPPAVAASDGSRAGLDAIVAPMGRQYCLLSHSSQPSNARDPGEISASKASKVQGLWQPAPLPALCGQMMTDR